MGNKLQHYPVDVVVRLLLIYYKQRAQVTFANKIRCIGNFDSREKAALAYEIMREKLKVDTVQRPFDLEAVEAAVKSTRKATFEALGLPDPVTRTKSKVAVQDPVARQKSKEAIEALKVAITTQRLRWRLQTCEG